MRFLYIIKIIVLIFMLFLYFFQKINKDSNGCNLRKQTLAYKKIPGYRFLSTSSN